MSKTEYKLAASALGLVGLTVFAVVILMSSGYSDSGIRGLSLISGNINPSNILSKNDGYLVRCVAGV